MFRMLRSSAPVAHSIRPLNGQLVGFQRFIQQTTRFGNENARVQLHAKDGMSREVQLGENGELSQQDTQWLNQHGGALPLNQVPQQDKAFIRQNPGSVAARWTNTNMGNPTMNNPNPNMNNPNRNMNNPNMNNPNPNMNTNTNWSRQNQQMSNVYGKGNADINLYAQDGSVRQVRLNEKGEIGVGDEQWLNQHGGGLPLNQVPQKDKAFVRQNADDVAARGFTPSGSTGNLGPQGTQGTQQSSAFTGTRRNV